MANHISTQKENNIYEFKYNNMEMAGQDLLRPAPTPFTSVLIYWYNM